MSGLKAFMPKVDSGGSLKAFHFIVVISLGLVASNSGWAQYRYPFPKSGTSRGGAN
jgi:hypothetical protein